MCDFANMGGGYGQKFQQFEQNHPQFQQAMQGFGGDIRGMQNPFPQPKAPVHPPGASVPTIPPAPSGAMAQSYAPRPSGAIDA